MEGDDEMEYCGVPPGFRFHPTEEELVGYYLTRKINSMDIHLDVIVDIDLYKMEPWDIQGKCKLGGNEEQSEWYFFSHKDKKYPTGTRTNRATTAGFWKATGRDKAVVSKNSSVVIGMRKTLVFYQGRAPNGRKTDWIMHEYRLHTQDHRLTPPQSQEGEWVVCRAFKKPTTNQRQGYEAWNHSYYMKQQHNNKTNFFSGSPSSTSNDQREEDSSNNNFQQSNHQLFPNHHLFVDNYQLQLPQLTTQDYEGSSEGICSNPIAASSFALEDHDPSRDNGDPHFLGYFHDS